MPGQLPISGTENISARLIQYLPTPRDEAAIMAGQGQWPQGYVPDTRISAHYRNADGSISPPLITVTGTVAKAALREFYLLPQGHALIGGIMRGEIVDSTEPNANGDLEVVGGNANRRILAGCTINFHDGSGDFVVEADEEAPDA